VSGSYGLSEQVQLSKRLQDLVPTENGEGRFQLYNGTCRCVRPARGVSVRRHPPSERRRSRQKPSTRNSAVKHASAMAESAGAGAPLPMTHVTTPSQCPG